MMFIDAALFHEFIFLEKNMHIANVEIVWSNAHFRSVYESFY